MICFVLKVIISPPLLQTLRALQLQPAVLSSAAAGSSPPSRLQLLVAQTQPAQDIQLLHQRRPTHHGLAPDVVLGGDDEEWTEDDEGEAEAILDQEKVEVALLGVGEEEVDVIVGDVEEDKAGEEGGGPAGGRG